MPAWILLFCLVTVVTSVSLGQGKCSSAHQLERSALRRFELLTSESQRLISLIPLLYQQRFSAPLIEGLQSRAGDLVAKIEDSFSSWEANDKGLAVLRNLETELKRLTGDFKAQPPATVAPTFQSVVQGASQLRPDFIYDFVSERGEAIRIRFSREMVETFFTEFKDSSMKEAAQRTLEAILKGYVPSGGQGVSGITFAGDWGVPVVKIRIRGSSAVGAYRVAGVFKDGVISIMAFDQSSNHDARFMTRLAIRASTRFQSYRW